MPDEHGLPIPEENLRALGLFVVRFSQLELGTSAAFAELIGGPINDGLNLANTVQSFNNRLSVLETVGQRTIGAVYVDRFVALVGQIRELNSIRNRFLHDTWGVTDDPEPAAVLARVRDSEAIQARRVSVDELNRHAKTAQDLLNALITLLAERRRPRGG